MTFYRDLSPYRFGDQKGDEPSDVLNIGWLAQGHVFPTGLPTEDFRRAILICAGRAVRKYRGIHVCDLCDIGPVTELLDGRPLLLGNGEIRVRDTRGQWYSAPTLIHHYVTIHNYRPPAEFVQAILEHAQEIFLVRGESLAWAKKLTTEERFSACIALFRYIAAKRNVHVEELVSAIERIASGEWSLTNLNVPSLTIADAFLRDVSSYLAACFRPHPTRPESTLNATITLLEDAANDYGFRPRGIGVPD